MTVNERLHASGKMEDFDCAVKKRIKDKVIAILREIEVDETSINAILKANKIE